MTPVEQIEHLQAENDKLTLNCKELGEKVASLESTIAGHADISAQVATLTTENAALTADVVTLKAERDAAKTEAQNARDAMALKPNAFGHITDGAKPVTDGTPAAESPKTPDQCKAEYAKIKGARAQADYRKKYAVQLGIKQ